MLMLMWPLRVHFPKYIQTQTEDQVAALPPWQRSMSYGKIKSTVALGASWNTDHFHFAGIGRKFDRQRTRSESGVPSRDAKISSSQAVPPSSGAKAGEVQAELLAQRRKWESQWK